MMKILKNAGARRCFAAVFTCVIYDVYNVLQSEQMLEWSFSSSDVLQVYGLSEKKSHGAYLHNLTKYHILRPGIRGSGRGSGFRHFRAGAHDSLRVLYDAAMKKLNKELNKELNNA
jgi:hypothetical protein